MHVYITLPPTLPPLPLTDHWALFLLGHCEHFPPIRMDSSGVRGHMWPFMDHREEVVVGGRWRGGGGLIWGFLWPLCQGMCVHSHHLLATNTETKACRHTLAMSPAMCPILAHHKLHHKALDWIVSSLLLFQWKRAALLVLTLRECAGVDIISSVHLCRSLITLKTRVSGY